MSTWDSSEGITPAIRNCRTRKVQAETSGRSFIPCGHPDCVVCDGLPGPNLGDGDEPDDSGPSAADERGMDAAEEYARGTPANAADSTAGLDSPPGLKSTSECAYPPGTFKATHGRGREKRRKEELRALQAFVAKLARLDPRSPDAADYFVLAVTEARELAK